MSGLPIGAHKKLQGATVMVELVKDLAIPGERLVTRTLSKVNKGTVLVQPIDLGTSSIPFPNHNTIADLYMVHRYCNSQA